MDSSTKKPFDKKHNLPKSIPLPPRIAERQNALNVQRAELERLMTDPASLPEIVPLDEMKAARDPLAKIAPPPEFVPSAIGSVAGAGSGEFHMYRTIRRKEQERLAALTSLVEQQESDQAFKERQEVIAAAHRAETEKRRAKRQRRKQGKNSKQEHPNASSNEEEPAAKRIPPTVPSPHSNSNTDHVNIPVKPTKMSIIDYNEI